MNFGSSAATGAFCNPLSAAVAAAGTDVRLTLFRNVPLVAVWNRTGWTPLEEKLLPI